MPYLWHTNKVDDIILWYISLNSCTASFRLNLKCQCLIDTCIHIHLNIITDVGPMKESTSWFSWRNLSISVKHTLNNISKLYPQYTWGRGFLLEAILSGMGWTEELERKKREKKGKGRERGGWRIGEKEGRGYGYTWRLEPRPASIIENCIDTFSWCSPDRLVDGPYVDSLVLN